jgi:hypothetical protein
MKDRELRIISESSIERFNNRLAQAESEGWKRISEIEQRDFYSIYDPKRKIGCTWSCYMSKEGNIKVEGDNG